MHSVKATAALISCLHTGKHFACDLQLTCNLYWSRLRTSKQQAGLIAHMHRGAHQAAHLKPIRLVCEALDPAIWQHIMAQQFVPKKAVEPCFQPRNE